MSVAHSSPDPTAPRATMPGRSPVSLNPARRLSHTLNNLLAVISGHLEVFEMPRDLSDDDQRSMAAIRRAIDDAAGVAREVAALSVAAEPRPADVNGSAAAARDQMARRFGPAVAVDLHAAEGLWHAAVDQGTVDAAVEAVTTRAAQAMPHGATMTLRTMNVEVGPPPTAPAQPPARFVQLAVAHPGAGLVESGAPRGPAVAEDGVLGGGRLHRVSDGARFASTAMLWPAAVDGTSALAPAPRPIRILLVERDERRRHLFEVILRSRHFVVASFEDPPADPPPAGAVDLLVADRRCDCGVPAVYTGAGAVGDRHAAADGQQLWLTEPFAAADLLHAVTQLARRVGGEA